MNKLAIIVAMEREITPLARSWACSKISNQDRDFTLFEHGQVLVVVAGMGGMNARAATDAVYKHAGGGVGLIVSAGLAGALIPDLKVGEIVRPAVVVDESDEQRIEVAGGDGTLVSCGTVADAKLKPLLASKYIARAVDMEAYAVADVARVYGAAFTAIKAISDELDFPMPPLGRFVSDEGGFQTGRFVLYALVRPWLWPTLMRLDTNSRKAIQALDRELEALMKPYA